jgi:hypothetical protein
VTGGDGVESGGTVGNAVCNLALASRPTQANARRINIRRRPEYSTEYLRSTSYASTPQIINITYPPDASTSTPYKYKYKRTSGVYAVVSLHSRSILYKQ